ncbi:MAG: SDR family oxidoreductase [Nitrospira sp.]|jgi:NAD(P)-dependent dehydrogenase (short-subunit alcohol dehydrogenase family)|nr:SDR family oxidoreductase [Nitrospira sp. BO4]
MAPIFTGKVALVTGGNSGIGLATALAFANAGARVVITGRDQLSLDQAAAQLGKHVIAVRSDAGSVSDGNKLAALLQQQDVKLDAIFLNAGISRFTPIEAVEEQTWDMTFNINVKGPYFLIKSLLPILNSGAAIVLNGSINAHMGMPNTTVYAASKAALISLAKTLSAELLHRGIRVNVVSPGPIRTPLYDRLGLPAGQVSEVASHIQAQVPLKRFGTPEEIANAVLYLAGPESAFVVGTELVVDGGMSQL